MQKDVIPLRRLHGRAKFLHATPANRGAGRGGRAETVAGDLQIGKWQLEGALIHEGVKEALLAIQQMIREVKASQPGIIRFESFDFAKLFNQLVFGGPIETIRRRKRVALEIVENLSQASATAFQAAGRDGQNSRTSLR